MLRILVLVFLLQLCNHSMAQTGSKPDGDSICANNTAVNSNCHFRKGSMEPSFPDDGKLRLYAMRFCPYCHRVNLVLTAKNISYNVAHINYNDKPEWFVQLNPNGKVPALHLLNEPNRPFLTESMTIAEYLDEKYPQVKLYPEDPLGKAQTKLWIERFGAVSSAFNSLVYQKNENDINEQSLSKFYTELESYETELKKRGTKYFAGGDVGIFDYAIWPWFERCSVLESIVGDKYNFDDRFPKLFQWIQVMKEDPAVKKHFLSTEIYTKYAQSVRDGNTNFNLLVEVPQ